MSNAGNATKTAVTRRIYLDNHNNFRMSRVISRARKEDKEVSVKDARKADLAGEYQSITAAAKIYGVEPSTLRDRLHGATQTRAAPHNEAEQSHRSLYRYLLRQGTPT